MREHLVAAVDAVCARVCVHVCVCACLCVCVCACKLSRICLNYE